MASGSARDSGQLPVQLCTWLPERSGYDGDDEPGEPSAGEWLYCLKDTQPGDRQVVWSGVHGKGIVAVVDFSGEVRPRSSNGRLFEGWGRISALPQPVSVEVAHSHPVLAQCFSGSIQGVRAINENVARAIVESAGGLPAAAGFDDHSADWEQGGGDWSGFRLPPEQIVEDVVLDKGRIARKLGFPSRVNPSKSKQRLPNGRVPDLWCEDGVVGEAKNQVTARWGPDQIEDYIEQCDARWPEYQWRGMLVQGQPAMAPNALARLEASRCRERIEVWAVTKRQGRPGHQVARLFPDPARRRPGESLFLS